MQAQGRDDVLPTHVTVHIQEQGHGDVLATHATVHIQERGHDDVFPTPAHHTEVPEHKGNMLSGPIRCHAGAEGSTGRIEVWTAPFGFSADDLPCFQPRQG